MNKDEMRELFLLLEDLNEFFHQPDNYSSISQVEKFARQIYPSLEKMYYKTVWDNLPEELKVEFLNR